MDGQGAQLLQQAEGLLTQLAQQEPEPEIQQAIQHILTQMEPLQQLVGKDDMQDMQSGLNNPGAPAPGGGEPPPLPGGAGTPALGAGSEGNAEPSEGGHPVLAIHIGTAPPKSFAGAKKAAKANFAAKGHYNPRGAAGEEQETQKARHRRGER